MTTRGFTLFDTSIGTCGIVWGGAGVVCVQLPEGREAATRARVLARFPEARETTPPGDVQRAVDAIVALLRGESGSLDGIVLDMEGVPPFHRKVYEAARRIPPGATLSYGEIAARLGAPGSARAVGQALGKNPFAIVVPCHRVLAQGGKIGGFSANGGVTTKRRLLAVEGALGRAAPAFDGDGVLGFDPEEAVLHLRRGDPALGRVIDAVGPFSMSLKRTSSVFGALAEAIVYQQLTAKAAATIYGRVCALFPHAHEDVTAESLLRVSEQKLRSAGLSRSKMLSLKDLARKALDGHVPSLAEVHRMDDEVIVERLTEIRGIGRWTVEMLLIFRLGRPDVLPLDDYGIRKGFAAAFGKKELPTRKDLERRGARWQPYRTVASWYLWRAAERDKQNPGSRSIAKTVRRGQGASGERAKLLLPRSAVARRRAR
jgi:methylated-DNA-[protein]-cysteine S-methyltransferase